MTPKTRKWPEETLELRENGCAIADEDCAGRTELAHVTKRAYDRPRVDGSHVVWVEPESILPLCDYHHREYDRHELDIVGYLTPTQQLRAVEDYGSITKALERIAPSLSRRINSPAEQVGGSGG